jgi:hypothetical protein
MANIEATRDKLIASLREVLPGQTCGDISNVLSPSDGRLWKEATLPYNLRLADSIGPLALVYRECSLGVRVDAHVQLNQLKRYRQPYNAPRNAKSPLSPGRVAIPMLPTL